MSSPAAQPGPDPQTNDLAGAIRRAIAAEIDELAEDLAGTDDAQLFGANEFKIRAIAHRIAAKAVEEHLARKKTDTTGPA